MKVILGPTPCATCRAPVTVVRRDVEQPCFNWQGANCRAHRGLPYYVPCLCHTHTIPDVGPFTAVDADGTRHECEHA